MRLLGAGFVAVALAVTGCASKQKREPVPIQKMKPMEAFHGQVVRVPTRGLPMVVFRIAFRAGSIDDPKGREGLTALTAALMAEGGTKELSSAELIEALFPMAADIGVTTDKELTVFYGTVHTDHVDRYLPLLISALTEPRWDPKELERLRADAIEYLERRLRTSDDENLGKAALDALIWQGHPYAHPDVGTVQGLKAITLEDAKAHAARVFSRDRMVIGVGGAVTDEIVARLESGLEALPETGAPLVELPEPTPTEVKVLVVEKEAPSSAISMGYPYALRRGDPDFYPMMVATSALGEHRQFVGRLMKELRMKRGLNYGDYAYAETFEQEGWSTFARPNTARRQHAFTVWIRPVVPEHRLFALRAAQHVLDRYVTEGITEEELETTKGFLSGYTLLWQQTPMRRLGYAIDDVFYGTDDFLGAFRESLPGMTREQVNEAIRRWIKPEKLRTAIVARDGEALRSALLESAPSPITYPVETPDPAVLEEDAKFVERPFGLEPAEVLVTPASELFER